MGEKNKEIGMTDKEKKLKETMDNAEIMKNVENRVNDKTVISSANLEKCKHHVTRKDVDEFVSMIKEERKKAGKEKN
jgi:hypothetical protein